MKIQIFALLALSGLASAQQAPTTSAAPAPNPMGGPPQITKDAPVTPVPFERILNANKEPQNWLTYSGGYASQRHSELKQVTPDNAKDLTLKWVFQSRSMEKHEVTPLVVDGVMYTVQGINDVVALNAVTGKQYWIYTHKPVADARNCCGQETRGLAIQGDKVFLATLDAQMIAINAKTGKEIWKTQVADPKEKYSFTHAPLVVKDKVIEGTAGGEFGIRGFIAAFDVNTGKEVWRFNTVPGPGEPGNETWAGDSWKHGGGSVWVTGSYDPDTNLTFWGIGNPGPDWNGDGRKGDNLYTCSTVALDADTGKLKWHYQFSPHNEFDWDSVQVPVLANMQFKGKDRKVMLWANRSGVFYVLDRTSGEFLLGKSFVKTNWFTGFDEKGRPLRAPGTEPTKEGVLIFPGNQGATNWYNPSYSPETGLFYIPAWENTSTIYLKDTEPPEFHSGQTFSGAFPRNQQGDEIFAAVRALDPKTGDKKWDFKLSSPSTEGGIMTTASNVLFAGGRDGQFVALDARDGKLLWETNLGPSVSAGPMTYAVNGKQYVSVQAGNNLYTFTLR
jgi:alcohol dehydrogenase (cytochrome c)